MKKFIYRILLFVVFIFFGMALLVIITASIARNSFDFKIADSKNILILGNSHPECALNDSIIPRSKNLAQSGSAYFYDYVKLKSIIDSNSQIDTLIIGYAYDDLLIDMESWLTSDRKINHQIKYYFFQMKAKDYWALFNANPKATFLHTPQTIFHNISMISKGYDYLGGYKALEEHKLDKAKKMIKPLSKDQLSEHSQYQSLYLQKIYDFCENNEIKLILLSTPIHSTLLERNAPLLKYHREFARKKMPNATLMDHSSTPLPESGFRDLSHLHFSGAILYSGYLKEILKK